MGDAAVRAVSGDLEQMRDEARRIRHLCSTNSSWARLTAYTQTINTPLTYSHIPALVTKGIARDTPAAPSLLLPTSRPRG